MSIAQRLKQGVERLLGYSREDPVDVKVAQALALMLRQDSNCVDVGAHSGVILSDIVRIAPRGKHVAFEPLPEFAASLRKKFPQVAVHELALAETSGTSEFQHVVRHPAYSGLRRRRYEHADEQVTTIEVRTGRLDDLLESDYRVDLLKIDVEGGELGVLQGGRRVLSESHPAIIFEHGLGAADFYGTRPSDIHALLCGDLEYAIFTLDGWLAGLPAVDLEGLEAEFDSWGNYMFVAVANTGGQVSP